MRKSVFVICVAVCLGIGAVLAGCGEMLVEPSDGANECYMPEGTYRVETVDAGGDCNDEDIGDLVDDTTGVEDVEIEGDRECGWYSSSHTDTSTLNDGTECVVSFEFTAESTAEGPKDAEMTMDIDCGHIVCEQDFNLYYEKR